MPEKSLTSPQANAGVKTSGITANLSTEGRAAQSLPSVDTVSVPQVLPLRNGSVKSILATIGAVLTIFGLSYSDVGTIIKTAATSSQGPALIIAIGVLAAVVIIYWKYMDRQTKLDLLREANAHQLTVQQIQTASDPDKTSVIVEKQSNVE